jgi:hypothetical protein
MSMTRGVVLAVIAATSLSRIAHAQAGERTLMHTFQEGSRIVYVTIVDRSSGPLGLVSSEDRVVKNVGHDFSIAVQRHAENAHVQRRSEVRWR